MKNSLWIIVTAAIMFVWGGALVRLDAAQLQHPHHTTLNADSIRAACRAHSRVLWLAYARKAFAELDSVSGENFYPEWELSLRHQSPPAAGEDLPILADIQWRASQGAAAMPENNITWNDVDRDSHTVAVQVRILRGRVVRGMVKYLANPEFRQKFVTNETTDENRVYNDMYYPDRVTEFLRMANMTPAEAGITAATFHRGLVKSFRDGVYTVWPHVLRQERHDDEGETPLRSDYYTLVIVATRDWGVTMAELALTPAQRDTFVAAQKYYTAYEGN